MKIEQKSLNHLEASDSVYIVMDGLDEADIDLRTNYPNNNAVSQAAAATFIQHLLSGRLLGKAKKLVTSRPRQLMHLPDEYSSNLYLNLLGLSDNGQSQICSDICLDNPAERDRITIVALTDITKSQKFMLRAHQLQQ